MDPTRVRGTAIQLLSLAGSTFNLARASIDDSFVRNGNSKLDLLKISTEDREGWKLGMKQGWGT